MHKIEIPEIRYTANIASCIEELNPAQYAEFIRLMLLLQEEKINLLTFKTLLVMKLADIKVSPKYRKRLTSEFPTDESYLIGDGISQLAELMETFFTTRQSDNKLLKQLNLTFTKNLLPSIGKLFGPADALTNCTFCEYRSSLDYYSEYAQHNTETALNKLVAVLYRPKVKYLFFKKRSTKFTGQIRIPFTAKSNPLLFDERVEYVAKQPLHLRYGVFLWFHAMQDFLHNGEISVSNAIIKFKELFVADPDAPKEEINLGWVGVLYTLAEAKTFGNMEETDNQNLYDVLVLLYKNMMTYKSIKSQSNDSN